MTETQPHDVQMGNADDRKNFTHVDPQMTQEGGQQSWDETRNVAETDW